MFEEGTVNKAVPSEARGTVASVEEPSVKVTLPVAAGLPAGAGTAAVINTAAPYTGVAGAVATVMVAAGLATDNCTLPVADVVLASPL